MTEKPEPLLEAKIASLLGNLKEPKTITAEYVITTPMFIGDANQDATRISAASVKGALRFWWRALMWKEVKFDDKNQRSDEDALRLLHQKEVRLFGGTTTELDLKNKKIEKRFAASFDLGVSHQGALEKVYDWPRDGDNNSGATYLGYGLLSTNEEDHRIAFLEDQKFTLKITLRSMDETQVSQLQDVLSLWGMFGGLGGRSRRGMGSVTLVSLEGENKLYPNKKDYLSAINSTLGEFEQVPKSPYTALSEACLLKPLASNRNARNAVDEAGLIYKTFRKDYRAAQNIAFGLPLAENYMDHRRGSPLIFHAHKTECGQTHMIALYIPASVFHHEYENVDGSHVLKFIKGEK